MTDPEINLTEKKLHRWFKNNRAARTKRKKAVTGEELEAAAKLKTKKGKRQAIKEAKKKAKLKAKEKAKKKAEARRRAKKGLPPLTDADTSSIVGERAHSIILRNNWLTQNEKERIARDKNAAREHLEALMDAKRDAVRAAFDEVDGDGSGAIDLDEFRDLVLNQLDEAMDEVRERLRRRTMRRAEHIGARAGPACAMSHRLSLSQLTLKATFAAMDTDHSGNVDFDEFLVWFSAESEGQTDGASKLQHKMKQKKEFKQLEKQIKTMERMARRPPKVKTAAELLDEVHASRALVTSAMNEFRGSAQVLVPDDFGRTLPMGLRHGGINVVRYFLEWSKAEFGNETRLEDMDLEKAKKAFEGLFMKKWNNGELSERYYQDGDVFVYRKKKEKGAKGEKRAPPQRWLQMWDPRKDAFRFWLHTDDTSRSNVGGPPSLRRAIDRWWVYKLVEMRREANAKRAKEKAEKDAAVADSFGVLAGLDAAMTETTIEVAEDEGLPTGDDLEVLAPTDLRMEVIANAKEDALPFKERKALRLMRKRRGEVEKVRACEICGYRHKHGAECIGKRCKVCGTFHLPSRKCRITGHVPGKCDEAMRLRCNPVAIAEAAQRDAHQALVAVRNAARPSAAEPGGRSLKRLLKEYDGCVRAQAWYRGTTSRLRTRELRDVPRAPWCALCQSRHEPKDKCPPACKHCDHYHYASKRCQVAGCGCLRPRNGPLPHGLICELLAAYLPWPEGHRARVVCSTWKHGWDNLLETTYADPRPPPKPSMAAAAMASVGSGATRLALGATARAKAAVEKQKQKVRNAAHKAKRAIEVLDMTKVEIEVMDTLGCRKQEARAGCLEANEKMPLSLEVARKIMMERVAREEEEAERKRIDAENRRLGNEEWEVFRAIPTRVIVTGLPSSTVPTDIDSNFAQPYGKKKVDKMRLEIPDLGLGKAHVEYATNVLPFLAPNPPRAPTHAWPSPNASHPFFPPPLSQDERPCVDRGLGAECRYTALPLRLGRACHAQSVLRD